jgi:hypothetical protein
MKKTVVSLSLVVVSAGGCSSRPLPSTPGVDVGALRDESTGQLRLKRAACTGVDLSPDSTKRDEASLLEFLRAQRVDVALVRDRADLVFLDVQAQSGRTVRLRVALLPNSNAAGEELQRAILEHGNGAWGVHRSNLAVLAPAGRTDDILAFAIRTKLACWGVLTVSDGDEARVIPGGYREL